MITDPRSVRTVKVAIVSCKRETFVDTTWNMERTYYVSCLFDHVICVISYLVHIKHNRDSAFLFHCVYVLFQRKFLWRKKVAMLACIGYIVPEFVRFPGALKADKHNGSCVDEDFHIR